MTIIAVLSQKGGAGKSTLARAMAVAALADGKSSVCIDADPQGTVIKWGRRRSARAPSVVGLDGRTLSEVVGEWQERGAAVIIIDTPPHVRPLVAVAAAAADVVVIPVRPSPDDLEAVGATVAIVREVGRPAGLVINAAPPRGASLALARSALATFSLPICPTALVERLTHQYASAEGLTALEREAGGKAAEEVLAVWRWLWDTIIIPSHHVGMV